MIASGFHNDDPTQAADRAPQTRPAGLILHTAARYDLLLQLATFGREHAFREKILRLARLEAGESVLDVGCGTGTLAIAAKHHVGPTGTIDGIDASPEMIARARRKAAKASVDVAFTAAAAQALPFPDARFDVVLTTIMLHHLARTGRQQCVSEISRVLKPGGRVLAVDFASSTRKKRGLFNHLRLHSHGRVTLEEIVDLLSASGLAVIETGAVGFRDTQFALAIGGRGRQS